VKFVSFRHDGLPAYGPLADGVVRMVDAGFLRRYPDLKSALDADALGDAARCRGEEHDAAEIEFMPVIPNPGKIVCIGMNYPAHTAELKREQPKAPSLFARYADSVVGHGRPIIRPRVSTKFDYEGELAVIIGREARHVAARDAYDFIAGYSCFLDGSLRDFQYRTSQFTAGKNFFQSGAFGPHLVTADEVPDPQALRVRTRVSGETLQDGNTSDMYFDIATLIEFLSQIFPLESGDVIVTGTPSGVGAAREPARWLLPGDVVEVEIENVGLLRNEVVDEGA
jgi:2-keto-4-pentenoate hydratase/2-oxohepta-3-ene-1,7-dioic acid hydratase in catechol pathway